MLLRLLKVAKALRPNNEWYFLTEFVYTDYPDPKNPASRLVKKLPARQYLRKALDILYKENKILFWKSRQLTFTWFMIAHWLYQTGTAKNGIEGIFQCDTEEKVVNTHFRKFDVIYRRLDPFLKCALGEVEVKVMSRKWLRNNSLIVGTPAGADVIASRNPNFIFSDEMSIQQKQAETVASSLPSINTGGQFAGVATTKPDTFFMDLVNDKAKSVRNKEAIQKPWVELQPYMKYRQNRNGWVVVSINYKTEPEFSTKEWIEKAHQGYTPEMWEQEMEMNENAMSGKPVFRDIDSGIFQVGLKWQIGKNLVRTWDFGYELGACMIGYKNTKDQYVFLREVLVFYKTTKDLIAEVEEVTKQLISETLSDLSPADRDYYKDKVPVIDDFCDLAGKHHTSQSETTDLDQMAEKNIYPLYRDSDVRRGLDKMRLLMRKRSDGNYGMLIDENHCEYLVQGIKGKYVNKENGTPKDSFYADVCDASRYWIDYDVPDIEQVSEEEEYEEDFRLNSSGLPMD